MSRGFDRRLSGVLVGIVLCLLVASLLTFRNTVQQRDSKARMINTYEVLRSLGALRSLLDQAASATRAFAITGQKEYLQPYIWAEANLVGHIAQLRALTAEAPDQRRGLDEVVPMIAAHMAYRALVVETVRTQGIGAGQDVVRTQGQETAAELVRRLEALESIEQARLVESYADSRARDRDALALAAALTFIVLAGLGASALLVRHYLAERQRAEAEGSLFFDLSLDLLVIAQDGDLKRLSPAVTPILGWTAAEMEGRPFLDFVHPDDIAATQVEIERQLLRGALVLNFENRYRHKDGTWRTLSWRSVSNEKGRLFGSARDVTEQRHFERLKSELEFRFRALFESLPGLYAVLDPDFTVVAASEAFLVSVQRSRGDLIGRNLFDAFPQNPADPLSSATASVRASLERVLATKATDTMPIQKHDIAGPEGVYRERYWSPIHSPVLGVNGDVEYIIHRVEDVTDFVLSRKDAAASALTDPNPEAMERMAAEVFRSAEAARAANIQLRASNAEMEAFSYSVSHDLRAPLRHIQGYAQMLERETQGQLSEKAGRFMRTISDATSEMGVLIDNLLAFSRMGRAGMSSTVVDLQSLAGEVQASLAGETRERNIQWRLPDLPKVLGDIPMLRQVLTNLFENAVKYTRPRNPAVIEMRHLGADAGQALFVVSDNGVGFDPKYTHKLFGVFQRLHRADEFEGTGIGLATVRRVVARHGGRTWARGIVGEGASLFFTLPFAPGFDSHLSLQRSGPLVTGASP